ncbi:MAG: tryptophan--tRNA ligase [Actinomycetales bacterium]
MSALSAPVLPAVSTRTPTRELSGITPSGPLTLGNYLGALRRFRAHQDDAFYFVANLHALTTEHQPARLRDLTLSTAALFLAAGLDPHRATVFLQSDVPAHVELGYLLESTAHIGELSRMIQFKEKGGRPGTRASLFTYPCLMAADILLYDADRVPVGGDQSQHVELTRDLAQRFNATYGPTFAVPELVPEALTARVRDLADPARKMSKSAPADAPGVIRVLDRPDVVRRKIRRAVTDSDNRLQYDPIGQPGLANLAEITAALAGETPQQVLGAATSYADVKARCVDVVVAELAPVQARHDELLGNPDELRRQLDVGAQKASAIASKVLHRARAAIGLGSAATPTHV